MVRDLGPKPSTCSRPPERPMPLPGGRKLPETTSLRRSTTGVLISLWARSQPTYDMLIAGFER